MAIRSARMGFTPDPVVACVSKAIVTRSIMRLLASLALGGMGVGTSPASPDAVRPSGSDKTC